jgi:hypothetical protein
MMNAESRTGQKKHEAPLSWNHVRAYFVARGDTVRKWSVRNGYHPAYVELSGTGKRRGPKAGRIVADLKRETGL